MPCLSRAFDVQIGPLLDLGFSAPATIIASQQPGGADAVIEGFQALIDTGASTTCISAAIAQKANLPLIGKRQMSSASQTVDTNLYLADIALPFGDPQKGTPMLVVQNHEVMEFHSNNPRFQALLGRDIICRGYFSITGYDNRFTLCM